MAKYSPKDRLKNPMNFARFCHPEIFNDVNYGTYLDIDMIVQKPIPMLIDKYLHQNDYDAWSVLNKKKNPIIKIGLK